MTKNSVLCNHTVYVITELTDFRYKHLYISLEVIDIFNHQLELIRKQNSKQNMNTVQIHQSLTLLTSKFYDTVGATVAVFIHKTSKDHTR